MKTYLEYTAFDILRAKPDDGSAADSVDMLASFRAPLASSLERGCGFSTLLLTCWV